MDLLSYDMKVKKQNIDRAIKQNGIFLRNGIYSKMLVY